MSGPAAASVVLVAGSPIGSSTGAAVVVVVVVGSVELLERERKHSQPSDTQSLASAHSARGNSARCTGRLCYCFMCVRMCVCVCGSL